MKKIINKNTIFGLIVGMIIMSGVGVLAIDYLYNANQVSYGDSNVQSVIDDLYNQIDSKLNNSEVTRGETFSVNRSTYTEPYVWDKENVAFVVIYSVYGIKYNDTISNYNGGPYIINSWDSTYHYSINVVTNPKVGDKFYCTGGNYGLTFYPYYYS